MGKFLKVVFGSLDRSYLKRQYFYGIVTSIILFFIFKKLSPTGKIEIEWQYTAYFVACLVFYPFAMFLYDSIVRFILGDVYIMSNIIFAFFWTTFKVFEVYVFSPFLGVIGMVYLYIKYRNSI